MARLFLDREPLTQYKDRAFRGTVDEYLDALRRSTTLYVGNVSFYTTETQMHALFSRCGAVRRIVVGLDRDRHTPCGFAFVEYETRSSAEACVRYLNGTTLDDREIRIDFDWGFVEGREFGRGKSGGQVRDEYRTYYDAGRGGYGKLLRDELEEMRASGGGEGARREKRRGRARWARKRRCDSSDAMRERERERERVVNTNCLFCTRAREATRFARRRRRRRESRARVHRFDESGLKRAGLSTTLRRF